ncbi:MAG: enoyl-CoA hydratase/isomerase family protein [Anaerolineae bacterium]|nr:enoyl-CoA hydratase/isomerase family protein [Anaerolineae bacterium]
MSDVKTYENILVRTEGRVGIVQLNRPKALNALSTPLMLEVNEAFADFDADDSIGCLVLTGSDKAFAAGADIKQMAEASVVEQLNMVFLDLWDRLQSITKPIIAAVSGWCLGGGCELAMVCDMIVASETARFGQPEINLGIIPGAGGTQRLTRAVGKAIAMEMVLANRTLTAEEALGFNLINKVAPADQYLDEAIKLAAEIASKSPVAVRIGKEAVNKALETTLAEGVYLERRLFTMLFGTEDQKEGMAAFIAKRPAEWKGK